MAVPVGGHLDGLCRIRRGTEVRAGDETAIAAQLLGRRLVDDGAVFEDVRAVGDRERGLDELLDQQHRGALLAEHVDHLEQLAHDGRRQALRHLVDHQKTRLGEDRASHRHHLLLPA